MNNVFTIRVIFYRKASDVNELNEKEMVIEPVSPSAPRTESLGSVG